MIIPLPWVWSAQTFSISGHPNPHSCRLNIQTLTNGYPSTVLPCTDNNNFHPRQHFVRDRNGEEKHAKRIAYGMKILYGIEFSWKVVMLLEPTVDQMIERIQEARVVRAPTRNISSGHPRSSSSDTEYESDASGRRTTLSPLGISKYLRMIEKDRLRRLRNRKTANK